MFSLGKETKTTELSKLLLHVQFVAVCGYKYNNALIQSPGIQCIISGRVPTKMKMATINFPPRCTAKQLTITILALIQMCLILLIMEKYSWKMGINRFTVALDRQTNVSNYDFYFNSLGQSQSQFFAALRTNVIYRSFGVKLKKQRQSVNLLLVVSSAPKRSDRRASIRETWWTLCRNTMRERDRKLVCLNLHGHCGLACLPG